MFNNIFIIAILIPLFLVLCSAIAKKVVRGTPFEIKDFFLGLQLSLTAMTSGLIYLVDLLRPITIGQSPHAADKFINVSIFLTASFFLFLWTMSFQQELENTKNREHNNWQVMFYGIFSNILGFISFISFLVFVKGF